MKLHSHIAKYIRRCGYAVALTLAAGCISSAADEIIIEYLPDEVPQELVDKASSYSVDMDLHKPEAPAGTPVWNTDYILQANKDNRVEVRHWAPFHSSWNYGIITLDILKDHYAQEVTENSTLIVKDAYRKQLQDELGGRIISYVGGASLLPQASACTALSKQRLYEYSADNQFYTEEKVTIEGTNQTETVYKLATLAVVYDNEGKAVYHYNQLNKTLYDKDGNKLSPSATEDYLAAAVGDYRSGLRSYIAPTDKQVDVKNNTLTIDHSGFGLAIGGFSEYGDVSYNTVYIHDVRCSDDVTAGAAERGDSHHNTLILVRSEAIGHNITKSAAEAGAYLSTYNSSGKVVGGWTSSLTTNDLYANLVFIYGSSVYQDVTGAMGGGNVYDNAVYLSHSEISMGLVQASASYSGYSSRFGQVYDNVFVIDDTMDAIGAGIVEEDMSYYGDGVKKTSSVPLVSTMYEDVIAGGSSRGYGDDAVRNNKVIIKGITVEDPETGESVTTNVQGNIFGGVASNNKLHEAPVSPGVAGSATNNSVFISDAKVLRDDTVPALSDPENEKWHTMLITVNVGCVTGGLAGAPSSIDWKPGNANNNLVVMSNTYYENSIYGGRNNAWWSFQQTDEEGIERGLHGDASNNVVILENLTSPVVHSADVKGEHSYDTSVYGGWAQNGHTNNNHVYISGTGNVMNGTFLHGGWGNRAQTNSNGEILGTDGNVLVSGAHYFDGTNFLAEDRKTVVGTYKRPDLVYNKGTTAKTISSGFTAFDGTTFFDKDGDDGMSIQSTALATRHEEVNTDGSIKYTWRDYLQYTKDVRDATFNEQGELVGCKFYVHGSDSEIATFKDGKITKNSGEVLLSGIAKVVIKEKAADGSILKANFYNSADSDDAEALIGVVGTVLTNRDYYPMKNEPPYNVVYQEGNLPVVLKSSEPENINGVLTFVGEEEGVTCTITPSVIEDKGTGKLISIASTKHIYPDGTVLTQSGSPYGLFLHLDGYDEYNTYTRGNWLHVDGFQGNIRGFDHFEKLKFIFTDEIDLTKPMITITGPRDETGLSVVREEGADPTPVEVEVDITQIADKLKPGDIIPVIGHEENASIAGLDGVPDDVVEDKNVYRRGVTSTFTLETEFKEWTDEDSHDHFNNFGVIEVLSKQEEATPEGRALIEGRIAMLTLNNMGGNLLAEQGIDSACRALEGGSPSDANTYIPVEQNGKGAVTYVPKDELAPGNRLFFAMSGAHNEVDSGSDVDVDGTNALVGVSRGFLEKRALTLGAFMETGWGKYHTSSHFGEGTDYPYVRGTGETSYVGAGALLRYRLSHLNKKLDGFSLDATLRAGRQETDYSTADLMADDGSFASYEHESDYIAGHVGLNYTFTPADKLSATLYARYLWTHISNDDADVCGADVTFEDMSSNRFRLGGRLAWQVTDKWMPYVGAAYEWECSGTARANTHGMGITAPSMRGGSVIGEIGTVWQPSLTRALWFEAALQGSVGKNENYGAKLGVSIGF